MEHAESDEIRDELAALVERQPEDVAALLRGWLVERH
jgi:flagellar M-ring protein FliF